MPKKKAKNVKDGAAELMTLAQAAAFLDVSRSTMYRLLDNGTLKSSKVGRQWRFRRDDLDGYLQRGPLASVSASPTELDAELKFFGKKVQETLHLPMPPRDSAAIDDGERKLRQLVMLIVAHAFRARASDIHLEPFGFGDDGRVRLRLRIDGVLKEVRTFSKSLHAALMLGFKVLSHLNAKGPTGSHGGHLMMAVGERELDLRVAVAPTPFGEALVGRLLDPQISRLTLDDLKLVPAQLGIFRSWLQRRNGFILVTGPTGSGKTTVLHACINHLVSASTKTVTVEDPVHYILPGTTQIQVDQRAGADFRACFETAMTMDPDIVVIGETDTGEIATACCRAALTGHLVLSSMHGSDTASVLGRLRSMMSDPFLLSGSLIGVTSQRLVRVLCPACKRAAEPPPALLDSLRAQAAIGGYAVPKKAVFMAPVGCKKCHGGYRGRCGVLEFLELTPAVQQAFLADATVDEIRRVALAEGMCTLVANGVREAVAGRTSAEEVVRVLHD